MKKNNHLEPTPTQVRALAHSQRRGEEALRGRAETIGELKDKISKLERELVLFKAGKQPILEGKDLSEMVIRAGVSMANGDPAGGHIGHPHLTEPEEHQGP